MRTLVDREDLVFSPPELGCVLYLPGLPGGDSKIHDRSSYGNIGTITGATWVRLPSGLWCLSFDGSDDYVNIPDSELWHFAANDITIELWTKRGATASVYFLMGRALGDGTDFWNVRFNGDDAVRFLGSKVGGGAAWLITSQTITDTTIWHHIVFLRDGNTLRAYIDGSADTNTSDVTGVTFVDGTSVLAIGRNGAWAGDKYNGRIALPRIHNRALSALEIQYHFNREKHLFGVW